MTPVMKPLLLLLAVLAFSSPLLTPAAAAQAKGPPTKMPVRDICDRTRANQPEGTYDVCLQTLLAYGSSAKIDTFEPLDLATALSLSVNASLDYAFFAMEKASGLVEDPKTDQDIKNCLIQCKSRLVDSVDVLNEMMDRTKDITYDRQKDKSVGSDFDGWFRGADLNCQETFDASRLKSPMAEIQERLNKLWATTKVIA